MRPWPTKTDSPSAATTTPSSGPATTWREDMELMRRGRGLLRHASASSRGPGSSPPRASTTSAGSTRSWTCCTPTASPSTSPPRPRPRRPWLSAAHPEILPVDRDGHTLWPGSRQAWCPSSPVYREHALALTTQLATALPRPPRPGDVARLQRVRLPQPALLLRRLRRPPSARWLRAPLRPRSSASTTPGAPPSGASATPTGSRSCRRGARRPSPTRRTQLDYTRFQLRRAARLLPRREGGPRRALPRRAR